MQETASGTVGSQFSGMQAPDDGVVGSDQTQSEANPNTTTESRPSAHGSTTPTNEEPSSNPLVAQSLNSSRHHDTWDSSDDRRASHPVPRRQGDQGILREHEPWTAKNVLSLDGGGIRGFYSLLIIQYLMTLIKELERHFIDGTGVETPAESSFSPCQQPLNVCHSTRTVDSNGQVIHNDFLPCHYFDYICGTSTGGLIAIMLSRLRMSVDDCMDEYLKLGGRIFGKPRHVHQLMRPLFWLNRTKYDSTILEEVIQEVTGRRGKKETSSRFGGEAGLCRTFVFAYKKIIAANPSDEVSFEPPYIFRSYDHFRGDRDQIYPRNPGEASTYEIWEVARATTAAPLFFKPMVMSSNGQRVRQRSTFSLTRRSSGGTQQNSTLTFVDGGFGETNNPADEAYHEIKTSNQPIGIFVSVGTGRKTTDRFKKGFANMITSAVDALGDTERVHERMITRSETRDNQFPYFRFNEPHAFPDLKFDEWKPRANGATTINKMKTAFAHWALTPEVQIRFQQCARELVRRRRIRTADASKWERYALGSEFICGGSQCPEAGNRRWADRNVFQDHLIAVHGVEAMGVGQIANEHRKLWLYKPPFRDGPAN